MQTGVLTSYELNQVIEFPIRVCDLTPNTHVGIKIYDLSKKKSESLLASTMVDIFDRKSRMRQGTYNLFLWKNKELDMSLDYTTPGLFYDLPENLCDFGDQENGGVDELKKSVNFEKSRDKFIEINRLLQKIHFYEKKEKCDDWKEWIDSASNAQIYQKL